MEGISDSERISAILEYLGITTAKFAVEIGAGKPTVIYYIIHGRNGISKDLSNKIRTRYPEFNETWLATGIGNMIDWTPGIKPVEPREYTKEDIRDLIRTNKDLIRKLEELLKKKEL
jgi:hypothetical protein